ncbi:hypothetical protein BpHYR1_010025 [Brachionus plicatilis]|uniref:Uncharacterized protein n=1 Tax=Brachionus plicatilis TaxID=10195 RepID=A0A3M7QEU9_BRAPC|nr:hypothetical protein BpHYR1_010025 [Brachionus plicatilis]
MESEIITKEVLVYIVARTCASAAVYSRLNNNPRSKVKQVQKNRLKYYFHSGHSLPTIKEEPVEQPDRQKRKYTKNLNNPRWKPIENHN